MRKNLNNQINLASPTIQNAFDEYLFCKQSVNRSKDTMRYYHNCIDFFRQIL